MTAVVDTSAAPAGTFQLTDVPDGALDLVAARSTTNTTTFSTSVDKMIIRRGVNAGNNSTLPVLDFGSAEAFDPVLGNLAIAKEVAERIAQYFDNNVRVLTSIGTEVQGIQLAPWQQIRILRNHVLDFPEFREISLFDASNRMVATSRTRDADVGLAPPTSLKPGGRCSTRSRRSTTFVRPPNIVVASPPIFWPVSGTSVSDLRICLVERTRLPA